MGRINILILTHSLHVGGAERHLLRLVSNIDTKKYNILVACLFEPGFIGRRLSGAGVQVFWNIMKNNLDLFGFWRLTRIARNENIDLIYIPLTPLTLFWGVLCAKITGIRSTVARSTTIYPLYHISRRRKIITSLSLPFVDRIIAQSFSHRDYLIESVGIKREKIIVLYNGVDTKSYKTGNGSESIKRDLKIPKDAPVIGIVARLVPEKGIDVFLRAAKRVVETVHEARFIIAGDGKDRDSLQNLARQLAIDKHVIFLGTRDDIPKIIASLDVAVMSSITEAFSNAILEYMAGSRPVVATDAGSNAEIVVDGDTGLIIPSGDFEALAAAVLRLVRNRKMAVAMGEAGRKRVQEKFDLHRMMRDYDDLFTTLLT